MIHARVSCFTNSYGRFGGQAALEHLPRIGIQLLELPIRTAGVPSFFGDQPLIDTDASAGDISRLQQRLDQAGLELSSCNITSGNPLDENVLAIILQKLELAEKFGVKLVVGGAGEADTPANREKLLKHLRIIGDEAARLDLVYCFETHPGVCQHPDSMCELMESLQHPHLKLNFDTGNILYYNQGLDVAQALRQIRSHVWHVHLKDTNGQFEDWHFPALGAGGAVDFSRIKHILDEVAYQGPYSLEIEGIHGEPELSQADYERRLEESLAHLKRCGY